MKPLRNLQKTKTYLEPKQASAMELFCEYTHRITIFVTNSPSHVWLGYMWASENIEFFNVKLMWKKSPRLLQCVEFLVYFRRAIFL